MLIQNGAEITLREIVDMVLGKEGKTYGKTLFHYFVTLLDNGISIIISQPSPGKE